MRTRIQRWGKSLALRIPEALAVAAHLRTGAVVELSLQNGLIVLTPVEIQAWKLEQLLAGVTARNLHHEIDTGPAVGREAH